jgi:hypothetical protein
MLSATRNFSAPTQRGGRFLIPTQMKRGDPTPITVVMNWQAALKK